MWSRSALLTALPALVLAAQTGQESGPPAGWRAAEQAKPGEFVIETGTRIPLSLINSVSTKGSAEGDRVYLETVFPILANGRIVIPPGSYVAGTITEVKRPGRVKGRGELYLRFDSLTLPNGVTRDFRARVGSLDGQAGDELDRREGKIKSEGNKSGDARNVGEATAAGTSVGVIAGSASGHAGMGAGIGAAAGAAAGMLGVLLTRGPDVVLARGTTLEMVLDRPLSFDASEIDFTGIPMHRPQVEPGGGSRPSQKDSGSIPIPGRRTGAGRLPY
jgi:type IV secretion system protein VirB10